MGKAVKFNPATQARMEAVRKDIEAAFQKHGVASWLMAFQDMDSNLEDRSWSGSRAWVSGMASIIHQEAKDQYLYD